MKKLMVITKSALALGLMLQAGYATEDKEEQARDAIARALPSVMATVKENFEAAAQIVDRMDDAGLLDRNPNPLVMRTGHNSVEQEYEDLRKERVKTTLALGLTENWLRVEQQKLFDSLSPDDQAIAEALKDKKW